MKYFRFLIRTAGWIAFGWILSSCSQNSHHEPEKKESEKLTISAESLAAAHIVVEPAAGGKIVRTLSLLGEIKPNGHNSVKVTAGVGGVVRELYAKAGDAVKAGDPLALLESREAAEAAAAEAAKGKKK